MEVAHIKKKNYLFFTHSHDKFLPSPLLTPLKKNPGVTIAFSHPLTINLQFSLSFYE